MVMQNSCKGFGDPSGDFFITKYLPSVFFITHTTSNGNGRFETKENYISGGVGESLPRIDLSTLDVIGWAKILIARVVI